MLYLTINFNAYFPIYKAEKITLTFNEWFESVIQVAMHNIKICFYIFYE
jgi:hypothetical protein